MKQHPLYPLRQTREGGEIVSRARVLTPVSLRKAVHIYGISANAGLDGLTVMPSYQPLIRRFQKSEAIWADNHAVQAFIILACRQKVVNYV